MKKILIAFVALFCGVMSFTGCAADLYADYKATGIEVKPVSFDFENEGTAPFAGGKMVIFDNYIEYAKYGFALDYTEGYFSFNDLLVFSACGCSSDGMEYSEILQKEGMLYPLFYRNEIGEGEPVTEDIIVLLYCAELPKEGSYSAGEILYRYR